MYKDVTLAAGERILILIKKIKGFRLVKPDHEYAIPIIDGVITKSNHEGASVNLHNDGIITKIPLDLVVECPAIMNKNGLEAIKRGDYPKGLAGLLRSQASVQD